MKHLTIIALLMAPLPALADTPKAPLMNEADVVAATSTQGAVPTSDPSVILYIMFGMFVAAGLSGGAISAPVLPK